MKLKSLTILILSTFVLTACADPETAPAPAVQQEAATPAGTRADPYVGHGVIEEVQDGQLVIQHDAIPGFMAAMTMGFPISDEVDVESLASGDEIMFDIEMIEPDSHRIFRVERVVGGGAPR